MIKNYREFWESDKDYALDISLFKEYWGSFEKTSLDELTEILEIKLEEKIAYATYSKYSWEEMQEYVFYEDIEFVLKQLKSYKAGNGFYSMQLEEFPYLVKRSNLLIALLKQIL